MTIDELKNKIGVLKEKEIESCKMSEIKNPENKEKFKYCGVYILTDVSGHIVYIGSAYARNLRDRLLQYQQSKGSGNYTLYKDLIDSNKCTEINAEKYVKSLNISAFRDDSLEYTLIKTANCTVNIAGNSDKRKKSEN